MTSEEVQIKSDCQVGVELELAMGMQYRGRSTSYNNLYKGRRDSIDNRVCYNCSKPEHVMQNCCQFNRRPDSKQQHNNNGKSFVQNKHSKHHLNKVTNVSTDNNNESEEEEKRLPLRMVRQKQKLPAEDNC